MNKLTIYLTMQEIDLVLFSLGKLPFENVANVFMAIKQQRDDAAAPKPDPISVSNIVNGASTLGELERQKKSVLSKGLKPRPAKGI